MDRLQARPGAPPAAPRWLVLFHRIPAQPHYLRVRVGRRLRALGAVAAKNSVYVLPNDARAREALDGVAREVLSRGGHAVLCEARFVTGLSDGSIEDLFRAASDREYAALEREAGRFAAALRGRRALAPARQRALGRSLARLEARFEDAVTRDRFGATSRDRTSGALSRLRDRLEGVESGRAADVEAAPPPSGATWVTRAGVMVDRIASAWAIRRFIDPAARFKFVAGRGYRPSRGELRFDMAGAEFTHAGDACTFEVLLDRFRLRDSALRCVAELVHDLDLEDARYRRPETAGLGRMVVGIALSTGDDLERIRRGATILDGLYESFRQPTGRNRS